MNSDKSLFYHPDAAEPGLTILFDPDESRHITKVLRMAQRDILLVTNGKGLLFEGSIWEVSAKGVAVQLQKLLRSEVQNPAFLHLAIAPTKSADRMEWLAEKAVEIGIRKLTFLQTSRTELRGLKQERFERIMLGAMKQSQRLWMPEFEAPVKFADMLKATQNGPCLIAHLLEDESERVLLREAFSAGQEVTVLIGPEGDFTETEITSALNSGYKAVSLGPVRLRTETAGLAACFTVSDQNT
ncbi:MAG: RsmE family RNA methyltransferase [Bacteroidota bacterium]